ncbi:MAG: hypothetical protein AMXMBFR20_23790 [Planctomycetia bacterium]|jgi:hypothetical protein
MNGRFTVSDLRLLSRLTGLHRFGKFVPVYFSVAIEVEPVESLRSAGELVARYLSVPILIEPGKKSLEPVTACARSSHTITLPAFAAWSLRPIALIVRASIGVPIRIGRRRWWRRCVTEHPDIAAASIQRPCARHRIAPATATEAAPFAIVSALMSPNRIFQYVAKTSSKLRLALRPDVADNFKDHVHDL